MLFIFKINLEINQVQLEVVKVCHKLAELSVGNFKMNEIVNFLQVCMVDKAISDTKNQNEAAHLLGLAGRNSLKYYI